MKSSEKKAQEQVLMAEDGTNQIQPETSNYPSDSGGGVLNSPLFHLFLIGILGFLIYFNTFHSPFQWDEAVYLDKPFIKDINYFFEPSRISEFADDGLKSRYIGYLTFALNYRLHGFDVFGYHVVNLAIHLINAVLVYFLVLLTFRTPFFSSKQYAVSSTQSAAYSLLPSAYSRFIALAVALLFVAHPIQTEAVTYVFQRFASLVSLFYLLSLVMYI